MALPVDLELLRRTFADDRTHIAVGKITGLDLTTDRSLLRVKVIIFPENREKVARMTWEQVGPSSGIFGFPAVDDLVLVAFAHGEEDQAFVIRRLTSKEDKIPLQAVDGSTVIKALTGKKTHVISDTAILLGKGGESDPSEPAVLGNQLKNLLSQLIEHIGNHTHTGNMGAPTSPPTNKASFESLKSSPVDDNGMLSDFVKLEK